MAEGISDFMKSSSLHIQDAQWTPIKINTKSYTYKHHSKNSKNQKKIESSKRNKWLIIYKETPIRLTTDAIRNGWG